MKCILNLFKKKVKPIKYNPVTTIARWTYIEKEILHEVNKYRVSNGLGVFIPEEYLHTIALERSLNLEHKSHDGVGEYFKLMKAHGFKDVTEILAFGYYNPESIVRAWIRSESHRKVLLADLKYCSIGYNYRNCVAFISN